MRKAKLLVVVLAMALTGSGCGTMANRKFHEPYGGVKGNLKFIANPWPMGIFVPCSCIDLVLCAVGDTLCLPYDAFAPPGDERDRARW